MADSKELPRNQLDVGGVQAVGGPVPRPWREGTLTRATELQALGTWAAQTSCPPENASETLQVLVAAVGVHLEAARQAANGMKPSSEQAANGTKPPSEQAANGTELSSRPQQKKRSMWFRLFHWSYWFPTSSQIQRAMSNLDAAEVLILNFAPPRYLVGQMPCLLNHVQRNLPPTDSRRQEFARIAQRVGVKDADHPLVDKTKEPSSAQLAEAEEIVERERGKIVTIVRGASSAALRDQLRLRSFRNILAVTIMGLTVLAISLAIFGWFYPTRVPLCFQPSLDNGQTVIVCPTAYSSRLPLNQLPGPELNAAVARAAKPWDHLTVELVGLIAAAVVATIRIRKIRGSSEAPDLPVLLALLKLPMGAIIAFLGILLVRGGFVPGLSALDTPAQILSWALVFGFAQQLFTRLVDQQGQTVLDNVRGADRPNEPGPGRP